MNGVKADFNNVAFDTEAESVSEIQADSAYDGEVIKLEGKAKEICTVWQLRINFIVLTVLLCTASFCFFLINF